MNHYTKILVGFLDTLKNIYELHGLAELEISHVAVVENFVKEVPLSGQVCLFGLIVEAKTMENYKASQSGFFDNIDLLSAHVCFTHVTSSLFNTLREFI